MITVGIDLSSQPARTAACEIRWSDGVAYVASPILPLADPEIVSLIERADITGIDVPLGWPAPLTDALVALRDGMPWPDGQMSAFLFRTTDEHVRTRVRQQPLAVGGDRIAWPAVRAARLLSALSSRGIPIDRSGATGRVVEVYPAAALRGWASQWSGYKGADHLENLSALAEQIFARDWLHFAEGSRSHYVRSDDAFDALVASLIARAHRLGLCEPIPPKHEALARAEFVCLRRFAHHGAVEAQFLSDRQLLAFDLTWGWALDSRADQSTRGSRR